MPEGKQKIDGVLRSASAFKKRASGEDGIYEFVASTEALDSHGTIIKSTAWNIDRYKNNGIVAYQHQTGGFWDDNDSDNIIGKGSVRIENKELILKMEFEDAEHNPQAGKIKYKVDFGSLNAVSVGFRAIKGHWGEDEEGENINVYYFDEVELLEVSIVNIPSNPEALKRSFESHLELNKKQVQEQVKPTRSMAMNLNLQKYQNNKSRLLCQRS